MPLPQITIEAYVHASEMTFGAKPRLNIRLRASEKKRDDGSYGDTLWMPLTLWEADAEAAAEFKEGDPITVTGLLFTRQYEKQDGTKGSSVEVKWPRVSRPVRATRASQQQGYGQQQGYQQSPPVNDPWAAPAQAGSEAPF